MNQLSLTGFYKPKRAEIKKAKASKRDSSEESVNAFWRRNMKEPRIRWGTGFGVKDREGRWVLVDDLPVVFKDNVFTRKVFDTHPAAFQLIGGLDVLNDICDEFPGVVLEEKKA